MAFNDAAVLAQDPTFQARVGAALLTYAQVVATENPTTVPFHRERANFAVQVFTANLNAQGVNPWTLIFANSVATDTTVIADATVSNTVPLTTANRAAQGLLVTDTHLSNAVSSQFNSYVREPDI
jgi:hypothetical protein